MIWIRYGMMLDILINLNIDDFYWVDELNPINSQEPVLQMVAIPPSYFRIVGGRGGGIHENVYIPCLSYWIEIWISACTQMYMTIVTVHSRFWSLTNNTLGPMLIDRECKCSGKYFRPQKNLNLGTEEHMCPIYTLCNNFLTQFPKHLCFNMTNTI